eukprot:6190874-Pleurochrysis_carterae.AAC.1
MQSRSQFETKEGKCIRAYCSKESKQKCCTKGRQKNDEILPPARKHGQNDTKRRNRTEQDETKLTKRAASESTRLHKFKGGAGVRLARRRNLQHVVA